MSRFHGSHGFIRSSTVVLAGLLAACGGEDKQAGLPSEGIVVAQASPAPVVTPVTTTTETGVPPIKRTNVTYKEADVVFRKGHYEEAAELFTVYTEENPNDGFGFYMLGLSTWKSGDHERAEKALLRAVELNGESVKVRTNLSRVLLEQGRPADALPHLQKAIELKPESFEVWRVMGNAQSLLGHGTEALESYRQALIRNVQDAWSMNNYGLVLIQQGKFQEALPPLARAVELMPKSALFQNNLGIALEGSGFLGAAQKAFSAAVDVDSTYTKARVSLERVQKNLGGVEGEPLDLSSFARSFAEEIDRWRAVPGIDLK
ncbi:MAG: tetratricopeptide repeat protein [Longimicrobiales bacterium]